MATQLSGFSSLFSLFFTLVFLLALGSFVFAIARSFQQWRYINSHPPLTTLAVVLRKRQRDSRHTQENPAQTSDAAYYTTFQLANGERMELRLRDLQFGMLAEGDAGTLTMQGNRFISFER